MLSRPVGVGWPCQARVVFLGANYLLRIRGCQGKHDLTERKKKKKKLSKQTNIVQKRNLFQAAVKDLEGEHKAERKHTQGSVFSQSLSLEAWTGPLSDLNLQPVCWHVDNTCSYAWLRHIRLWNSTASAAPLTICHFLQIFSIMALLVRRATLPGAWIKTEQALNSFMSVPPFFFPSGGWRLLC